MREADGRITQLGLDRFRLLWLHLKDCGYINAQDRVQDQLKHCLPRLDLDAVIGILNLEFAGKFTQRLHNLRLQSLGRLGQVSRVVFECKRVQRLHRIKTG
jgi:hypothetical protein